MTPEGTVALKTSGKIDAFRTHYLFSETGSLPFGGREDEIKVLNEWLADEAAPRRLLITGPTGRGKSTLLVHWAEALIHMPAEDPWQIVFLPISIRFGTNRPSVFYHLLASQLADSLNHPLQTPVMDPEGFYTGVATSMLQELAARMTKVLIVVDGVDEALDQRFDATIFPIQLPITLKIVVSARELANDAGAEGWKKRLGWDANVRVKSLEVSILDKRGVVAVLQSVGLYPGKIHDEVINRILELTEGEPLLLKLYAEDLLLIAHQQEQINISDLVGLKPGFGAYVSRWFEHQRQAWKEEGNTIDLATDGTLAVLACALGPLQTDHLVPLVCKITGVAAPLSVEHFIRPVRRFVTGSGTLESGYILNHPMLGQYLCEEYFDDSIVSRVHEEFANWGRINVELLKKGNFQNAVPPYLLQYYVQHLKIVSGTIDDYADLLNNGWRLAWERFEGSYRGFSANIHSVLNRLGPTQQYLPDVTHFLRIRVRAALSLSSVQSIGSNCPDDLLALSLDERLLTLSQAKHYISLQLPENQSQFVASIFKYFPEDQAEEVIATIYKTKNDSNRALFLSRILENVPNNRRERLIADVLGLITKLDNPQLRDGVMISLVFYLNTDQVRDVFCEAVSLPITSENAISSALLLGKLSEYFKKIGDAEKATAAIRHCLAHLDRAEDTFAKVDALSQLAYLLPTDEVETRVQLWNLVIANCLMNITTKIWADAYLSKMQIENIRRVQAALMFLKAQQVQSLEYEEQLDEVFQFLDTNCEEKAKLNIITRYMPLIREESKPKVTQMCFQIARRLPSANNRTYAMIALAKNAPNSLRKTIVRESLTNIRLIEDDYSRCLSLVGFFSLLSQNEKLLEFPRILAEIHKISYVLHRGSVIIKLATHFPEPKQAHQLFKLGAYFISQASDAYLALNELLDAIEKLPALLRATMFRQFFEQIIETKSLLFPMGIAGLAKVAPDLWLENDLNIAYSLSFSAPDPWSNAYLLSTLASVAIRFGRSDIIALACEKTVAQHDLAEQVRCLENLIPHLKDSDSRREIINHTWERARIDFVTNVAVLVAMFPFLSDQQREENWCLVKKAILLTDNNSSLLKKLSDHCHNMDEKNELLRMAFASAANAPLHNMANTLKTITPSLSTILEQLKALDFITELPVISRPNLLGTLECTAAFFLKIGGTQLVREIMYEIYENAELWS